MADDWDLDALETPSDTGGSDLAAAPRDHRALLQSLIDANPDSDLAKLASEARVALIEREDAYALAAAQIASVAEATPRTVAQIMAELERVKAQGLDADQGELTAALAAVDELQAGFRAEVEATRAQELQSQVDGIYRMHVDAGDGEEMALREAQLFLDQAQQWLGIEKEQGADPLNDHPAWNEYLVEDGNLRRQEETRAETLWELDHPSGYELTSRQRDLDAMETEFRDMVAVVGLAGGDGDGDE